MNVLWRVILWCQIEYVGPNIASYHLTLSTVDYRMKNILFLLSLTKGKPKTRNDLTELFFWAYSLQRWIEKQKVTRLNWLCSGASLVPKPNWLLSDTQQCFLTLPLYCESSTISKLSLQTCRRANFCGLNVAFMLLDWQNIQAMPWRAASNSRDHLAVY